MSDNPEYRRENKELYRNASKKFYYANKAIVLNATKKYQSGHRFAGRIRCELWRQFGIGGIKQATKEQLKFIAVRRLLKLSENGTISHGVAKEHLSQLGKDIHTAIKIIFNY